MNKITVKEVAEKLGMAKTERGDYVGTSPEDRAADFLLYTTSDYRPIGSASSSYLGGQHYYTAKQVAELAGIPYEQYEGYVPEPQGSLLERATEAAMQEQQKKEEQAEVEVAREKARQINIAIHAMQSVLGVEINETQVHTNPNGPEGFVHCDGMVFSTEFNDVRLQKICPECGAAMWWPVHSIAMLGQVIQKPPFLCAECHAAKKKREERDYYTQFDMPTLEELRMDAYMALDEVADNDELHAQLTVMLYAAEVQRAQTQCMSDIASLIGEKA